MVELRKIRILAVDHNPLLREGLSLLFRLQPDIEIVGVVSSGEEAVKAFNEHRPNVTLMDLDLPAGSAIKAIREILKVDPDTCVIGSSTFELDEACTQAFRAGVRSCITKDRLNQELISLMRDCVRRAD